MLVISNMSWIKILKNRVSQMLSFSEMTHFDVVTVSIGVITLFLF